MNTKPMGKHIADSCPHLGDSKCDTNSESGHVKQVFEDEISEMDEQTGTKTNGDRG